MYTKEEAKKYFKEYYEKNKEEIKKRTTQYAKDYPERRKAAVRKYELSEIGWTPEMYESAFISQGGVCAICGKPELKKQLSADHDHDTNEPRELLCQLCNAGIGMFLDSPKLLELAAYYLRKHGK
jgi:hypothetical protein